MQVPEVIVYGVLGHSDSIKNVFQG